MNNSINNFEIFILEKQDDIKSLVNEIDYLQENIIYPLLRYLNFPQNSITVFLEKSYVDKVYRDVYYSFFSNKHFNKTRNCQRLSFFYGKLDYENLLGIKKCEEFSIEKRLVGTMVLKPTFVQNSNCTMGRTLFDPEKLHMPTCYIRTTEYHVYILGREYTINAFPLSGQDGEMMSCAETCLWEILEYYGTRYPDYRTILPNDINEAFNVDTYERIKPSNGMQIEQVAKLLKSFGFEPRVYFKEIYENKKSALTISKKNSNINLFKHIFHYYVESAIPIVVGLESKKQDQEGHCVICIGHGELDYDLSNLKIQNYSGVRFANSADFCDKYVVVDDNRVSYQVEEFDNFSLSDDLEIADFIVPLYKHIFLEANSAEIILNKFLKGFAVDIKKLLQKVELFNLNVEPIITRLFLTTSRNYKRFRVERSISLEEKLYYSNVNFPKFIWVCEYAPFKLYKNGYSVGEVIIDATASEEEKLESVIAIRVGDHIGARNPEDKFEEVIDELKNRKSSFNAIHKLYRFNLKKGGLS